MQLAFVVLNGASLRVVQAYEYEATSLGESAPATLATWAGIMMVVCAFLVYTFQRLLDRSLHFSSQIMCFGSRSSFAQLMMTRRAEAKLMMFGVSENVGSDVERSEGASPETATVEPTVAHRHSGRAVSSGAHAAVDTPVAWRCAGILLHSAPGPGRIVESAVEPGGGLPTSPSIVASPVCVHRTRWGYRGQRVGRRAIQGLRVPVAEAQ